MGNAFGEREHMKIIVVLLLALVPAVPALSIPDPGEPDTVRIDSVVAQPGGKVALPVYFYNDEALSALEIVLKYDSSRLLIDSFSVAGGRLDYIAPENIVSRVAPGLFDLWVGDYSGWIPSGNGLLCNIFFYVDTSAGGLTFPIDTAFWEPVSKTLFADSTAVNAIYPQIVKGYITVAIPPPSPDSIWVDNVTGAPGQTVEVPIHGFNEESLSEINLALKWTSDNLIYKTVAFNDTRGDSAWKKTVNPPAGGLNQLLITLEFQDGSSLHPGSGPLGRVIFDVAPSAPDEVVTIDSSNYSGIQSTELCVVPEEGGLCFAPRFNAGQVDIVSSTAVLDRDESILPKQYSLGQNVPNPFNPSTEIWFELPKACDLKLEIYNILGQSVRTLIDGRMSAGQHHVTFDGRGDDNNVLASGVYFYRLVTEEFTQSRKMTLMK